MPSLLVLDDRARADVRTLLGRAGRFGETSVRLTAHGDLVLVTVPLTVSSGLLDAGPTILGVRVVRMREAAEFDAVVPADAVMEALGDGADLDVPAAATLPAWASISAPRQGWRPLGEVSADDVRLGASAAAARIERELPASPGDAVVRRVRRAVWGQGLDGEQLTLGHCAALDGLGFLGADPVEVSGVGAWTRASTRLGDVLAR
ncbi:hypothetical protein GCM10009846_11910 [Agrococcus versicolor]|uniref:Uncharacterized protein n=1 Tax=Agrococcus versicolor TaxID=501482 RepID=A0ABN3APS1_9MICO